MSDDGADAPADIVTRSGPVAAPSEPLLDWVEREIEKPGYSLLRAMRAQRSAAGQRIILEELTQLVRAAAGVHPPQEPGQ
jgi:hypothetical protein